MTAALESLTDLAARSLGGGVMAANDEFFAAADQLVSDAPATFAAGVFGAKGQVYDGWETRRRRDPGHDWAIVRLGAPGVIRGVVIDTAFFRGNYPPFAAVEACGVEGYPAPADLTGADWVTIVPRSPLAGDSRNLFDVTDQRRFTHVRLSIYPDGGVARLRVHGEPVPDPRLFPDGFLDLAALEHGGRVVDCSDRFYGSPANLLAPGLARVMGEGWETARRRDDRNDWVLIQLAAPGRVRLVELDATHFKGNAPAAATLRGIDTRAAALDDTAAWFDILPRESLRPDTSHRFRVDAAGAATHVRLDIYPDGGLARLRLWTRLEPADLATLTLNWFNLLPPAQARAVLPNLPEPAAERLVAARPLTDPAILPPDLRAR